MRVGVLVAVMMVLLACTERPDAEVVAQDETLESEPTSVDGCTVMEELNALDHRTPVPLQPMMAWHQKENMMDHLVAIQLIVDGAARQDWEAVQKASRRIESSPQMEMMCHHMGAGAPGFTELALTFHRRADEIGKAARSEDKTGVLEATAATLEVCTTCHATYRQELVDAATWKTITGSDHVPHHGH